MTTTRTKGGWQAVKRRLIERAVAAGIPREYAENNPFDVFMRGILGKKPPSP